MELELASEGHQGAHEVGRHAQGGPPSWTGCGLPGLHLCRGFFINYPKIFRGVSGHSENFYFLHKNNTMVILLKTASVRVSSIQIIQVRVQNKGKSVWKSRYDGDISAGTVSFLEEAEFNEVMIVPSSEQLTVGKVGPAIRPG